MDPQEEATINDYLDKLFLPAVPLPPGSLVMQPIYEEEFASAEERDANTLWILSYVFCTGIRMLMTNWPHKVAASSLDQNRSYTVPLDFATLTPAAMALMKAHFAATGWEASLAPAGTPKSFHIPGLNSSGINVGFSPIV